MKPGLRIALTLSALFFFMIFTGNILAKTVSGNITMSFDLSAHAPDKEVRLWTPYPISDDNQLISNIKVSGNFTESGIYTDRVYQTPMLFARWNKGIASRHLTLSFKAQRREVIRRDFPSHESAWDPKDYRMWLQKSSLGPITGPVKDLADSITRGQTTVLQKAKAIYDWTCENMYRDPDTQGCGIGDVEALLRRPGGKCTDIHSVFVALARAAGVPAREIFGIRMGKKTIQDITGWQHCWAEFYLPGYGWVPVDPADVRKMMLKHHLKLDDPKTIAYRKYYWGGWDPYRIQLAVGRDVVLNPAQSGPPLNTFGYPYAEVGGNALDWLDADSFRYRFRYEGD